MSKFEVNDNVEITNVDFLSDHELNIFNVKIGDTGIIAGFYKPSPVFAIVENNKFKNSKAGDGKLFVPISKLKKLNSKYMESNRYKLQKAIKKTGFHAEKLSLASNHAKTYFTGFTAESRFNSRGDITEERLNSLLTTLAFAERELLGVGAKTVDDIALDETQTEKEVVVNVTEMKNRYYDDSKSNDLYSNYFESASKRNQSKRDAKVKKVLIVFVVVVVLLALWFLFK